MALTAIITLWGKRLGAIAWNEQTGVGAFEYDREFIESGLNPSPIMMPTATALGRIFQFLQNKGVDSTFKGLPGLLADMMPDKYGNAIINSWLAAQGRAADSLTPIEILCFIGKRGIGALEVEPAFRDDTEKPAPLDLEQLVDIANAILQQRLDFKVNLSQDTVSGLTDILKIGTSAGGARAKAVIVYNPTTGEVRSGQVPAPKGFSHWILKFDGVSDEQFGASSGYGRVEMAYYLMAKDAGIEMADCKLLHENGRAHFITQRFDRDENGEKIHMQSFCAMRHFDFNLTGYFSYEQLFETLRLLHLPYPAAEQVFRRMVFNVLGRNCDDHTKNFAFLMDKSGKWSLSPAFDVCYAYRPDSQWVSMHSLTINGKRDFITNDDLIAVATQMHIKKPAQIIAEITAIVKNWAYYAKQVAVSSELNALIQSNLKV